MLVVVVVEPNIAVKNRKHILGLANLFEIILNDTRIVAATLLEQMLPLENHLSLENRWSLVRQ